MYRALTVVTLLVSAARPALANRCDLTSPRTATGNVAANCPLVVYVPTASRGSYTPSVSVRRGDTTPALATTIDTTTATLDIATTTKDPETCLESTVTAPTDMTLFSITVDGIAEGDWIRLDGGDIYVGPPATSCPTYLPTFYCDAPAGFCNGSEPVDDDTSGGCNAIGVPGLGIALGALALCRRRRLRRR